MLSSRFPSGRIIFIAASATGAGGACAYPVFFDNTHHLGFIKCFFDVISPKRSRSYSEIVGLILAP